MERKNIIQLQLLIYHLYRVRGFSFKVNIKWKQIPHYIQIGENMDVESGPMRDATRWQCCIGYERGLNGSALKTVAGVFWKEFRVLAGECLRMVFWKRLAWA